jgi:hypothetical protein
LGLPARVEELLLGRRALRRPCAPRARGLAHPCRPPRSLVGGCETPSFWPVVRSPSR